LPASIERAGLLLQQSRFELAEREVRGVLADEPGHPIAHAWLALCLAHKKDYPAAIASAREAVGLAPDEAYVHYVMADVLGDAGKLDQALRAIRQSIELGPDEADAHAAHADILRRLERPKESLEAAERGLEIDPEHVACNNIRAMALVRLGRKAEAGATIGEALAREPENATTHANMGWTLLHQGDPKKAMHHFAEALRLNPDMEWARAGIVEALKARNPLYRMFLAYFLFMARLGPNAQWGVIIGGYLGSRVLRVISNNNAALAPYLRPVIIAYVVFAISTWLAYPLFNLLLRVHPLGRHALSADQRWGSNWLGLAMLGALAALAAWGITGDPIWQLPALAAALVCLPVAATFQCPPGKARWAMVALTLGLVAGAASLPVLVFAGSASVKLVAGLVALGCMLSGWIANGLNTALK
jgi:tetratricopeptide (TPR) repeat protein